MTRQVRFADAERGTIDDIVDLDRYPIDRPGSPAQQAIVDQCRAALADDGCCTLTGFVRPEALAVAAAEFAALAPKADIREEFCSVYVRGDSEAELAPDDPRGHILRRRVGHITRDQIPPDSVAQRLYVAPALKAFIAACVGESRVFEYADPLAALIATVLPPGGTLPWHYDTNEFVVTILTQEPEAGGLFQFHQNLRRPGDENLPGLARVLDDDAPETLRTRDLRAGDFQLFLGRYSLHRVTTIEGNRERHVAVLSYANRPGVIGPIDRTRAVYGRVTEAHVIAHEISQGADGLIL
jgi:hypothetical protein